MRVRASDIAVAFRGLRALDGVTFQLRVGELIGVIGPNGAGKTTLMNVLSGFVAPSKGRVCVDEADITRVPPFRRVAMGVVRTFQNVRPFRDLTVTENVQVGAVATGTSVREAEAHAREILSLVGLAQFAAVKAGELAYGYERRLALARALATRPSFLLLDEPAAGLSARETDNLMTVIESVRSSLRCGISIIEHDMRMIMGLCERIQVLDHGKTISEGTPREVRADRVVREAYLGSDDATATAPGRNA